MTPEELDAIAARCEAATPGPWTWYQENLHSFYIEDVNANFTILDSRMMEKDATFIASARTDVPRLVEEVRALRDVVRIRGNAVEHLQDRLDLLNQGNTSLIADLKRERDEARARLASAERVVKAASELERFLTQDIGMDKPELTWLRQALAALPDHLRKELGEGDCKHHFKELPGAEICTKCGVIVS